MEFDERLKLRARLSSICMGGDRIELYGYSRDSHHSAAAKPLLMQECKPNELLEPICLIDKEQAQVLMDDLWLAGLRPTEGSGSSGSLKAVQNHLADMKKILFHKMGIKD